MLVFGFAWVAFIFVSPIANPWDRPLIWLENGKTTVTDYAQDYQMGVIARSEERWHAYDPETQNRVLDRIAAPLPPQEKDQNFILQTMPFYFAFMVPWSLLPLKTSYYLFWTCMLVCANAGVWALSRKIGGFTVFGTLMLSIVVFTSAPAVYALRVGQAVIFLLALLCGFIFFWCRNRPLLAGICLGLATARPQYSVIFLAPMIMRKKWKMFAAFFVTEVALLVVSILTVGWDNVINYPAILFHHDTKENYQGVNPQLMISLRGVLVGMPQPLVLALTCAIFAIVFLVLLKVSSRSQQTTTSDHWLMCVTLLTAMVFAPHSHFYDVVLLAIPAALTMSAQARQAVGNSTAYQIWCLGLIAAPFLSWLRIILGSQFPPAYLFLPLHLLMLTAGCIICFKNVIKPAGHDDTLEEKVRL